MITSDHIFAKKIIVGVSLSFKLTLIVKFLGYELDRLPGKLIQSSVWEFWGMTQAVFMENSSKKKHLVENHISRILGRDTGRITGKLIQTISQFLKFLEFIWENKGRKNLYF